MLPTVTVVDLRLATRRTINSITNAARDGCETGGILLGHQEGRTFRVTVAGDPGPMAIRTPDRFRRDPDHAQQLADQAWTDDRSVWIGEWHTHPRGPVAPSDLDLNTYLSLLQDPELGLQDFLSIIVIPNSRAAVLYPWVLTATTGSLAALTRR